MSGVFVGEPKLNTDHYSKLRIAHNPAPGLYSHPPPGARKERAAEDVRGAHAVHTHNPVCRRVRLDERGQAARLRRRDALARARAVRRHEAAHVRVRHAVEHRVAQRLRRRPRVGAHVPRGRGEVVRLADRVGERVRRDAHHPGQLVQVVPGVADDRAREHEDVSRAERPQHRPGAALGQDERQRDARNVRPVARVVVDDRRPVGHARDLVVPGAGTDEFSFLARRMGYPLGGEDKLAVDLDHHRQAVIRIVDWDEKVRLFRE